MVDAPDGSLRQTVHVERIHDDYEAHYYDEQSLRYREQFIGGPACFLILNSLVLRVPRRQTLDCTRRVPDRARVQSSQQPRRGSSAHRAMAACLSLV
jgi:hypothetical protein